MKLLVKPSYWVQLESIDVLLDEIEDISTRYLTWMSRIQLEGMYFTQASTMSSDK